MENERKPYSYTFAKIAYLFFLCTIITGIVYCIKLLFWPLIASVLLTFVFSPVVNFLETRGKRRSHVIVALFAGVTVLLSVVIFFIIPRLVLEAHTISQNMPLYKSMIEKGIQDIEQVLNRNFPQVPVAGLMSALMEKIPLNKSFTVNDILQNISSFFTLMSLVVLVPFITFFLLLDGHLVARIILSFVPNAYFEMTVLLIHKVTSAVKDFLRGQIIDASAVGLLTMAGLAIIGIPYAVIIGVIAGLGNLVPYLGPIIGFIPAVLSLLMSPEGLSAWSIIAIIIVFVIVQFIEGTFIYPIAVGRSVDLHPLVIIVGVTVGGQIGGIIGMLLIIPVISIVKVTFTVLHTYLKSYSII